MGEACGMENQALAVGKPGLRKDEEPARTRQVESGCSHYGEMKNRPKANASQLSPQAA